MWTTHWPVLFTVKCPHKRLKAGACWAVLSICDLQNALRGWRNPPLKPDTDKHAINTRAFYFYLFYYQASTTDVMKTQYLLSSVFRWNNPHRIKKNSFCVQSSIERINAVDLDENCSVTVFKLTASKIKQMEKRHGFSLMSLSFLVMC